MKGSLYRCMIFLTQCYPPLFEACVSCIADGFSSQGLLDNEKLTGLSDFQLISPQGISIRDRVQEN